MTTSEQTAANYVKSLVGFLEDGDRDNALGVLSQWAAAYNTQDAIEKVLDPALNIFGCELWSKGKVSLGQAYVMSKVAEDIFNLAASDHRNKPVEQHKGPIIIGNIQDDTYSLGRKLVITFLKLEGWNVIDLGCDVTAVEFLDAAETHNAQLIGVSAMMLKTAKNIASVRKEIDKRKLQNKIMLAVGGAVFTQRPELVKQIGGDGTAINALKAPALFDHLLSKLKNEVIL